MLDGERHGRQSTTTAARAGEVGGGSHHRHQVREPIRGEQEVPSATAAAARAINVGVASKNRGNSSTTEVARPQQTRQVDNAITTAPTTGANSAAARNHDNPPAPRHQQALGPRGGTVGTTRTSGTCGVSQNPADAPEALRRQRRPHRDAAAATARVRGGDGVHQDNATRTTTTTTLALDPVARATHSRSRHHQHTGEQQQQQQQQQYEGAGGEAMPTVAATGPKPPPTASRPRAMLVGMLGLLPWLLKSVLYLLPWLSKSALHMLGALLGRGGGGSSLAQMAFGLSRHVLGWLWAGCSGGLGGLSLRGFQWMVCAAGFGASGMALHYFSGTAGWTGLRDMTCAQGASLPVVGDWVRVQCASRWGNKGEKGPLLPSSTYIIITPTDGSRFVDADMYAEDLWDVSRSILAANRRPGGQVAQDVESQMDREADAAVASVRATKPALANAARQVGGTQSHLIQVLDYLVLYPGGETAWYERFMADFITTGSDGSKGLRRRVRGAISILAKAQADRAQLLKTFKTPVSLPTYCQDQPRMQMATFSLQEKASQFRASRKRRVHKIAQLARQWSLPWRQDREQELAKQAGLAKVEKREIDRLEHDAVSGPAILAARVAYVCHCAEIVHASASGIARSIGEENAKLEQAREELASLLGEIVSWGFFPQSNTIQEGQEKFRRTLRNYLDDVASIYR